MGLRVRSSNKCASPTHIWVTFFRDYYGADFVPTDDCRRHCLRCSGYAVKMSKLKARLAAKSKQTARSHWPIIWTPPCLIRKRDIICAARRLVRPMMAAAISPRHPKSARCSASLLVPGALICGRVPAPQPVNLVELGPGRGTLMADICRTTGRNSDFTQHLSVHFVETSPALRAEQKQRVPNASWHDSMQPCPKMR